MASSLEELLAEEGYRGRRSGMTSRASFRAEAALKSKKDSPSGHWVKMEKTTSDISRYSHLSRKPRDYLVSTEKASAKRLVTETSERYRLSNNLPDSEESEITEIGEVDYTRNKDLYSDKVGRRGSSSSAQNRYLNNSGSYNNTKIKSTASSTDRKKKLFDPSYESSARSTISSKHFEGDKGQKLKNILPELALDEVAVKAMVSILNSYIKRVIKDDDFRIKIRQNCFSSLSQNYEDGKSKAMANLEQAIEMLEKAAIDKVLNPKDLKMASMRLSMITSMSSNDMCSELSACAHLYLSVAYKLQKKDKVSAKHLLQVFSDSPFLARAHLLPELWGYLLFPHLSHLENWYNQEVDSLMNLPDRVRKLELLDKVYDEILDSGTYQIAVYYKDWLTEGIEAPSLPSIHIPTMPFQDQSVLSDSFSPRPMVSKKLYETVFGHSITQEIEEIVDNGGEIYDGSSVEVNKALAYSSEIVKYANEDIRKTFREDTQENRFPSDYENLSASKEEWKFVKVSSPENMDINGDLSNFKGHHFHLLNSFPDAKSNELILMNMAELVFESRQNGDSGDLTIPVVSQTWKSIEVSDPYELELDGKYECFEKGKFIASPPEDFICPLSGKLFEDPVTLETGQTFEREAINDWFKHGNKTCPVTGKLLKCQTVPFTNFILKRVVDIWKLEQCSHLMALATKIIKNESSETDETAVFIFEMLLTSFNMEQRSANAKHLVSLGGLEFLIKRFTLGNLEERTRVAALLLCCIEGDGSCRNRIMKNIESHCLLELLQSKQPKSRRNSVLLLIQLVCLSSRIDVKLFLSGLQNEEIMNAKHILLIYLETSAPEQTPWVAALLLHLDLLVEPQKYSIYREKAVDAITTALNLSLTVENIRESSCRVLLALGGSLTENWALKEARSRSKYAAKSQEDDLLLDESLSLEDEEETMKNWRRNLLTSLLNDGKRSFLNAISKCLESGSLDLVKASLITIVWLSFALSSLSDAEMQLSSFSALISGLKENLVNSDQMELKVLASLSLLNFTKIPECRVLLMTMAEEIAVPLWSLVEVSSIAKELYHAMSEALNHTDLNTSSSP